MSPDLAAPAARRRVEAARTALCVVVLATGAYATIDKGAFFVPASSVVFVTALAALAIGYLLDGTASRPTLDEVALVALAAWWWVTALVHHDAAMFLPLGASMTAFLAAAVTIRRANPTVRTLAARAVPLLVGVLAVIGLAACDLRWYPMASRAQDLWRLSSTLTYSNAAGLLFAMSLVLAVGCCDARSDGAVWSACLSAGLVATQSRGAVVALLVAALFVPWRRITSLAVSLLGGACAGLLTVTASSGDARRPWALAGTAVLLLAAVLCQLAVAGRAGASAPSPRAARARRWAPLVLGAVALGALLALSAHEVATRVDVGSDLGRIREARLALDQFTSSPLIGVGPDQPLTRNGYSTYFAHDEYLQVLAGGGLVGLGLLAGSIVLCARRLVRRSGALPLRSARAAVVAFAVGGLVDYSWHLPAVAVVAGVAMGLATPDAAGPPPPVAQLAPPR